MEGAEEKVLNGMQGILQNHKPIMFIEIINALLQRFDSSAMAIYSIMRACGYRAYAVTKQCSLRRIANGTEGYDVVFLHDSHHLPHWIKIEP